MRCVTFLAVTSVAVAASVLQGAVIDDFSANSSGSYNRLLAWNNSNGAYAINASGQFAPTTPSTPSHTTYFIRNKGEKLTKTSGDTVSIDIISLDVTSGAGLAIDASVNSLGTNFEVLISHASDGYRLAVSAVPSVLLTGFDLQNGAGKLSISRDLASPGTFYWTVSGGGLQNTLTGSFTKAAYSSIDVYFGMAVYRGGGSASGNQIVDNLALTPVPEAASLAVLSLGSLLLFRRR